MIIRIVNPKPKKKGVRNMARKRRKNPRHKRKHNAKRRRRNPAVSALLAGNPKRRRNPRRKHINPAHHYRRRRNPSLLGGSTGILAQIKPMAIGALGAIALNWAVGKIPMQDNYKPWAKLAAAVAVPMFIKHPAARLGALVLGALAIKDLVVNAVPQLAGEDLTPDEITALQGYAASDLLAGNTMGTNVVFGAEEDELLGTNVVFGDMGDFGEDYDM